MVAVSELTESEIPEVVEALVRLLPQLSSSAPLPTQDELLQILWDKSSHVLIARDDTERIVGSLTLIVFRIPTGIRAWIEDVVVDESARGKGVGETLNRHAISMAIKMGARTVDLTSRPSRVAANNLYKKIGFEQRETNVYRYNPTGDEAITEA